MNKLLLMSQCMPPISRGPSVIISRLFKGFPAGSYAVFMSDIPEKKVELDHSLKLSCPYYYTGTETEVGGCPGGRWASLKRWARTVPILLKGLQVVKKEKCTGLLAFSGFGNFLLASYLIHKIAGIPLYLYLFDLFRQSDGARGLDGFMTNLAERLSFGSARRVFVMSEKLKEYYQVRYPSSAINIVRHPANCGADENAPRSSDNKAVPARILFTGMIYEYQIDAIQNLADAVKSLNNVMFCIYTQRDRKYLEDRQVLGGNVVYCGYSASEKMADIQRAADILFLPMSFYGPGTDPDVIKTASPSKIGEYLAAKRPILVHAPKDSYVAWYAREHGFGLVVDEPDVSKLKLAVTELVENERLRNELVLNAGRTARMHDLPFVTREFMKALELVPSP